MLLEQLREPRVAIIDDVWSDAEPIRVALERMSIKAEFFDASPENLSPPEHHIEGIELIFLDLYYDVNFNATFDPEKCAQIIESIVPEGKKYVLVIWSKDTDKAGEVLDVLRLINLMPVQTITKSKTDFIVGDNAYNVEKLLMDIDAEVAKITDIEEFYGEIVTVKANSVIIDCLINEAENIFQQRKFDRLPFENVVTLEEGQHISIRVITKPGSKIFEFSNVNRDIKSLFSKESYFKGIDKNRFKPKE